MSSYVKGGAWTNIEDEILKAAVQKYGINQWARVSSLLPKKSDLQAKSRWDEYLNPTINKSSTWTKAEDKRLLELSKLIPNQWRTIASVLGHGIGGSRTATQCLERFQKLIDDAAGIEPDQMRLSGPGIESLPASGSTPAFGDAAAETLPARPDDSDLEDDEREMLAEAKARLANTQGKKAKRKARERILEESKRIALLQKRRDMKAAGINISLKSKNKKRKKEFDYAANIPHQAVPAEGPFDVTEENEQNEKQASRFKHQVAKKGVSLKEVDDKIRSQQRQMNKQNKEKKRPAENDNVEDKIEDKAHIQFKKRKLDGTFEYLGLEQKVEPTIAVPRKANKSVRPFLKGLFDKLPQPKHHKGSPKLIGGPEISETAEIADIAEPVQNAADAEQQEKLKLLSQISEENAREHRTQVVQLGLPIPHPSSLSLAALGKSESSLDFVESLVAAEMEKLVKSDYRTHRDSSFPAAVVVYEWDKDAYAKVHAEIEDELKVMETKVETNANANTETTSSSSSSLLQQRHYELPQNFEAAEEVIAKLHELYNSAEAVAGKLEPAEYVKQRDALLQQIQQNHKLLAAEELRYNLVRQQASEEQRILQEEKGRLTKIVARLYAGIDKKINKSRV
ncbi:uncharacterized protein LODBEIA_P04290 [Lodderomyces beijingensis]|uniref:Pre-mRNA-splicing factor CEF1 n=1 Tax=Lodderomyces beijingensis TaxID=1775926 RepID=A0ABP0ZDE9_9ASCO